MQSITDFLAEIIQIVTRLKKIEAVQQQHTNQLNDLIDVAWRKRESDFFDQYLSLDEVSKKFSISKRWILEQRRLGELSWIQLSDRKIFIQRQEVERWIESKKINRIQNL